MDTLVAIFVFALLGIVALAASKPDDFKVTRRIVIKAPPEKIFGLLENFKDWKAWSPWEHIDPDMTRTHSGTKQGIGAVYEWEGNKKVGAGRMEIRDTALNEKVLIKLDFLRPMKVTNTTEFHLTPEEDGVHVSWSMYGSMPLISKIFSLFVSMDKMIGKDFDQGLQNLKAAAEKA